MDEHLTGIITSSVTTKRREWWGWFGVFAWFYFMMYGYNNFMLSNMGYYDGSWYPFFFMGLLTLSIAVFGFIFGRDPGKLARISFYTVPVAILLTVLFPLLPVESAAHVNLSPTFNLYITSGTLAYMLSPVFMAPALARRVFGVVHTAGLKYRLTRYMSGVAAGLAAYTVWILIPDIHQLIPFIPAIPQDVTATTLFKEIMFLIPAALAVPVWLGIRRDIDVPETKVKERSQAYFVWLVIILFVLVVLLSWMDLTHAVIHSDIGYYGDQHHNSWYTLLAYIIPPISCILFAVISDKGYERVGIICGMGMFLICIMFALMYVNNVASEGTMLIPLAFADGFGGGYTEFFIWSFPIYFLVTARRPVFVVSLGAVFWLFSATYLWKAEIWLPEKLLMPYTPELVIAAIAAVGVIILAYLLFERYKEKSLAAALYTMIHTGRPSKEAAVIDTMTPAADAFPDKTEAHISAMHDEVGLLSEERQIAALLMDGYTKGEIARKLHMQAGQVGDLMHSIRGKVASGASDSGVVRIAEEYKLTTRELHVLQGIYEGKSRVRIAEENFISPETVKFHTKNLLRKLPVENLTELRSWLDEGADRSEGRESIAQ